jgi:hypothetical protein
MRASTIISIVSIFISIGTILFNLVFLAPHARWAADTVYALSIWTESKEHGVTLRYLGVLPIASCWSPGNDFEAMKRRCAGRRYKG